MIFKVRFSSGMEMMIEADSRAEAEQIAAWQIVMNGNNPIDETKEYDPWA